MIGVSAGQRRGQVDDLDPAGRDGVHEGGERGHAANDDRRGCPCHPSRCHPRPGATRLSCHDCSDRDRRACARSTGDCGEPPKVAVDGLDLVRTGGRRVRLPRTERLGQDDDDPLPARPGVGDRGPCCGARAAVAARALGSRCRRIGAIVETPALFPTMTGQGEPRAARRRSTASAGAASSTSVLDRSVSARRADEKVAQVLARDAPTARPRRGAAEGSGAARARRAGQRARPGRHPRDP